MSASRPHRNPNSRYNRIEEGEFGTGTMIYVNVLSLNVSAGCVSTVSVTVYQQSMVPFGDNAWSGMAQMGRSSSIISTSKGSGRHPSRVTGELRDNVDLALSQTADFLKREPIDFSS